ncbi:peptidyl-prolyl cis-trans isomerase FKBP2-like protein [Leptotrombidium deliense]|uniref:peptidylprolyl isomerase n=1 Tax=Leptotrombidium deliense TaxID=299467 RepID=A0A443SVB8_9ACAR|nr:peptidyl-prolyl cis-trans isomerase FKBP2-like protein [Leptotrombidium deliense]
MFSKIVILLCVLNVSVLFADDTGDLPKDLKIETLSKPDSCDRQAKRGDMLTMHYRGTLLNGKEFDSSHSRKEPFKFQLGVGHVIKGWDLGLIGMCVKEKRKLTIPPNLGYGKTGAGEQIPPDSTLVFEVECINIEDGANPTNVFKEIDSNQDSQLSREEISDYLKKQLPADGEGEARDEAIPEQDQLVEEIFQHEDHDKNGFISFEEFSGPKHDEL